MPLPLFVSFPLTSYDLSNLQGFAVLHSWEAGLLKHAPPSVGPPAAVNYHA